MNAIEKLKNVNKLLAGITFFLKRGVITKAEAESALKNGVTHDFVFRIQQRVESRRTVPGMEAEIEYLKIYCDTVDTLIKIETSN